MKKIRAFVDLLPLMLMWMVLSVFVWGFVFNLLTDTSADRKLTLYVDAPVPGATDLAVLLEDAAFAPGIDMVKVHPFTYALMGSSGMDKADLYIVRASHAEEFSEWFMALPGDMPAEGETLSLAGVPTGLRAYDRTKAAGAAASYIAYDAPEAAGEDYYLFFGRTSRHVPGNEGAVDGAAVEAAKYLLKTP